MKKILFILFLMGVVFSGPAAQETGDPNSAGTAGGTGEITAETGEITGETPQNQPLFEDETNITFDDAPETVPAGQTGGMITAWDVIRMILIFLCVLLVIYIIFRLLKRAGGARFQATELIKVHGSCALGASKSLHLVEVGQELFLVGAGDTTVNLISKIEDKDSVDELRFLISSQKGPAPGGNFQDLLGKFFNREKKETDLNGSLEKSKDFLKSQRDRLKKM